MTPRPPSIAPFPEGPNLHHSGCQAYIIREGWEGLVRGNAVDPTPAASRRASTAPSPAIRPTWNSQLTGLPDLNLDAVEEPHAVNYWDPNDIAPLSDAPLSFGYGGLLRDGAGEGDADELAAALAGHIPAVPEEEEDGGRTLKGRYIVRVGWDDVRGWLGEGGTLIGSSRCPSCKSGICPLKPTATLLLTLRFSFSPHRTTRFNPDDVVEWSCIPFSTN